MQTGEAEVSNAGAATDEDQANGVRAVVLSFVKRGRQMGSFRRIIFSSSVT